MSFWEDRFVNRPHASAVSSSSYTDPHSSMFDAAREVETGHAWSDVSEPAADLSDDAVEPGLEEPEELEVGDVSIEDDELAPAVEYRRSGLFRRRTPVQVDDAAEDEAGDAEVSDSEPADDPDENEGEPVGVSPSNGYSWYSASVEPTSAESTESEQDDVDDDDPVEEESVEEEPFEAAEAPVQEHRRRSLFRRRRNDEVEPDSDSGSDSHSEETVPETYEIANNGWSVVSEPVAEPFDEPVLEPVAEAFDSEPEADDVYVVADEESADVDIADEAVDEPSRRGFFRRRKPVTAEGAVEEEIDPLQAEAEALETEWHGDPYSDVETAESEDVEDVGAAAEAPTQERRRGLFRRRKQEQADAPVDETDASEDPVESVEDDAFEAVPFYSADVSDEAPEPGDASDDGATVEPVEDDAYVLDQPEESQPEASEATPEPSPEPLSAESEVEPEDDVSEAEPVADEPVFHDEPALVSDGAAASADVAEAHESPAPYEWGEDVVVEEPAASVETELESDHEPVAHEWQADDTYESHDEPESHDEEPAQEIHEPVPLKKRNGGGSKRGKKVVGLKVGASQIAAAVVAGSGDSQALVDLARRPLEQGVVVDGELRDPEALVRALKSFFKEHGLPSKNIRLGLSSSRVGVRTFDVAGIDDETRFDNAVRFKAHEVLPVAAHESVLDYRVVEEQYTESGDVSRRVLLVVAPRDQVEPYIEACRAAGLRLAGVDLEAFGLLRAFVPPLGVRSRSEDSATVVVSIGHESSTLLVAGGGVCEFTRVFDWGGGALQSAIADQLEVPHMEAATILTHLSLSGPGRHLDSLDADARSKALDAVRTRLMPFARELVSSLQFYQTQPESLGIREILITGGTSHLEGLADALHQMIGVSVRVGDPLARVDVQTEIPLALDATIGSLAVPIGLAIEDEAARSVNLLPKDARQTRKRPSLITVGAPVAAAVPLLALGFLFMQASGTAGDRQSELDAVRAEIAALPVPTKPNIDPALAGEQAARATAVAQILGGRLTWERVLGDVTRVLPKDVSLTELTATTPLPTTPQVAATTEGGTVPAAPVAAPTAPTGVTVAGYALDYETIARALARLQAVPSLTNAQLQSATPSAIGKKRVIEFTIVADLAATGGTQ